MEDNDTPKLCLCGQPASITIGGVYHLCGVHAAAYYDRIEKGEKPDRAMQAVLDASRPK